MHFYAIEPLSYKYPHIRPSKWCATCPYISRNLKKLTGKSMVFAIAKTTSLACSLFGHSKILYKTLCFRFQRRSNSSTSTTIVSLFFLDFPLKYTILYNKFIRISIWSHVSITELFSSNFQDRFMDIREIFRLASFWKQDWTCCSVLLCW